MPYGQPMDAGFYVPLDLGQAIVAGRVVLQEWCFREELSINPKPRRIPGPQQEAMFASLEASRAGERNQERCLPVGHQAFAVEPGRQIWKGKRRDVEGVYRL